MHQGGSYGRGTSVKGRVDVDLPIFVDGFNPNNYMQTMKALRMVGARPPPACRVTCEPCQHAGMLLLDHRGADAHMQLQ